MHDTQRNTKFFTLNPYLTTCIIRYNLLTWFSALTDLAKTNVLTNMLTKHNKYRQKYLSCMARGSSVLPLEAWFVTRKPRNDQARLKAPNRDCFLTSGSRTYNLVYEAPNAKPFGKIVVKQVVNIPSTNRSWFGPSNSRTKTSTHSGQLCSFFEIKPPNRVAHSYRLLHSNQGLDTMEVD